MANTVTIDGVDYIHSECKCTPGMGHTCYLRPAPQVINAPIEVLLAALAAPQQLPKDKKEG